MVSVYCIGTLASARTGHGTTRRTTEHACDLMATWGFMQQAARSAQATISAGKQCLILQVSGCRCAATSVQISHSRFVTVHAQEGAMLACPGGR